MRNTIRKHIWNVNMKNGIEHKATWSGNDNDEIFWWMAFTNEWKRSSSGSQQQQHHHYHHHHKHQHRCRRHHHCRHSSHQRINSRIHIQLKKFARHRWKFYLQENHPREHSIHFKTLNSILWCNWICCCARALLKCMYARRKILASQAKKLRQNVALFTSSYFHPSLEFIYSFVWLRSHPRTHIHSYVAA